MRRCERCKDWREANLQEHLGLRLTPLPGANQTDTIGDAINRVLHEEDVISVECPHCGRQNSKTERYWTINASPEYLRIHLNRLTYDDDYNEVKNRNSIGIPDILDITRYMKFPEDEEPWPVRYKLVSATYHSGSELTSGHYAASVTGPKGSDTGPTAAFKKEPASQYFCNDDIIQHWSGDAGSNMITTNPVSFKMVSRKKKPFVSGPHDPTILFYARLPPDLEEKEAKKAEKAEKQKETFVGVDETIADRVRSGRLRRQCRK